MSDKYILDGKTPVPEPDLMKWGQWFQNKDSRRVASDVIGDVRVSTVFLGLNHAYDDGPPMLFETMIFGGVHDEYQERCSTWEQAEAMHAEAVKLVRQTLN